MSTPEELSRLERAVQSNPHDAKLRYLLGAELAQHQQYPRAVAEMKEALVQMPDLHTARLQLGLLLLTLGQPAAAMAVWSSLERLPEGSPLRMFKQGLEALIRDDFNECIRFIEAGILRNSENAPLNHDMRLIVDKASATLRAAPPSEGVRTDFSLYEQ